MFKKTNRKKKTLYAVLAELTANLNCSFNDIFKDLAGPKQRCRFMLSRSFHILVITSDTLLCTHAQKKCFFNPFFFLCNKIQSHLNILMCTYCRFDSVESLR